MARGAVKKRYPVAKVGNYATNVDTAGMDEEMQAMMIGTAPDKEEAAYLKGTGGRKSAITAIKRTRRANKQPLLKLP